MDRALFTNNSKRFRLLVGLAVALGLVGLAVCLPQSAFADAGGVPSRTPTRTQVIIPTATQTLILLPTTTRTDDAVAAPPTALPANGTPTVDLAPLLALLSSPPAATALPTTTVRPPLALLCWPFALGFVLLAIIVSLWLLGRRPVSSGVES